MNTVISGISGGEPFEIMLTFFDTEDCQEQGGTTALLTVRQKDTDLDAKALKELGDACLRAAKILRGDRR